MCIYVYIILYMRTGGEIDMNKPIAEDTLVKDKKRGIIDFHSHILPGMDDGSKNLEMSLQILDRMANSGVNTVLATSHFYGYKENAAHFLQRREKAWQKLNPELKPEHPEVLLGAEVAFFSGLTKLSREELDQLCLAGTRTLLVEMPFDAWTGYEIEVLSNLTLDKGYHVLLAHFERFVSFQSHSDIWDQVLELPIDLQINAESLLPLFSRGKWLKWYKHGFLPVLGSDCHNLDSRPPNLMEARTILQKKFGTELLERIDRQGERLLR